jgi:hypothetical protein
MVAAVPTSRARRLCADFKRRPAQEQGKLQARSLLYLAVIGLVLNWMIKGLKAEHNYFRRLDGSHHWMRRSEKILTRGRSEKTDLAFSAPLTPCDQPLPLLRVRDLEHLDSLLDRPIAAFSSTKPRNFARRSI